MRTFKPPFSVLCRFFDGWGLSDEVNIPSPDEEGERREGGRRGERVRGKEGRGKEQGKDKRGEDKGREKEREKGKEKRGEDKGREEKGPEMPAVSTVTRCLLRARGRVVAGL